ncbi:hypothetical protein [Methylomonas koyamae]|nr:hypothetical protein [Methylomonas koyamae]
MLNLSCFADSVHQLLYGASKIATERDMTQPEPIEPLVQELQEILTRLYGPLLASRDLWKLLGFTNPAAYRQARLRQRIPVVEFEIEGRRGRFALTQDVARWLAEQRLAIPQTNKDLETSNDVTE